MDNVTNHPQRLQAAMREVGGPLICDLDGMLAAFEHGLLVIASGVDAEHAAEIRRELRCSRAGLDAVKEAAGIVGYCGSAHLYEEEVDGGAA